MDEPDQFVQGKAVSIALRPENIYVTKDKPKYDNNISAIIKEVIFVGDALKVKVINKKQEEMMIKVKPSYKELTIGKEIILNWDIGKCSLIGN
ncbi:TOBE domain-containing protein [Clostridium tyrobutyricum]